MLLEAALAVWRWALIRCMNVVLPEPVFDGGLATNWI